MCTLIDFSDQLYLFHADPKYDSMDTLIKEASGYFMDELGKVDEKEFAKLKIYGKSPAEKRERLLQWIDDRIKEINIIVKRKSNNEMQASMDLYKILFNDDGTERYKNILTEEKQNSNFYRMRKTDMYEVYDRKGLFVIMDNAKHLVGDYRFNPSGYACLYLAKNLFLAWEECRRPDFDKVNFSRFVNTRKIKVLDLTINRFMFYKEQFLLAYLTLLCCAKTNDSDKFHYQYVVPHMMMEILCESQRKAEANKKPTIDGIKYLSSRRYDQKDFLFHEKSLCNAYVFPKHCQNDNNEEPQYLGDLFRMTKPRSYFLYKTHCLNFFNKTALVSTYQESLFFQLEEQTMFDKTDKYYVED